MYIRVCVRVCEFLRISVRNWIIVVVFIANICGVSSSQC